MAVIEQGNAQYDREQVEKRVVAGRSNDQLKSDGDPRADDPQPARHQEEKRHGQLDEGIQFFTKVADWQTE